MEILLQGLVEPGKAYSLSITVANPGSLSEMRNQWKWPGPAPSTSFVGASTSFVGG